MPFYARKTFIASVGALAASILNLVAYLAGWPAEAVVPANAVLGAVLAVWRAGVTPDKPVTVSVTGRRGFAGVGLMALVALGTVVLICAVVPGVAVVLGLLAVLTVLTRLLPRIYQATRGARTVWLAHLVGLAALLAGGCAHTTCPDGAGVRVSYRQGPPSSATARCTTDPADTERVSVRGPGKGRFDVLCPAGYVPGPGASAAADCDGKPCTRSELTCVEAGK